MADLSGRVALITGSASGIGRASALAFASARASVALVDVDAHGLTETAVTARKAGSRAEEIAAAAVWLCSPEASYVTGSVLVADGGWLAG